MSSFEATSSNLTRRMTRLLSGHSRPFVVFSPSATLPGRKTNLLLDLLQKREGASIQFSDIADADYICPECRETFKNKRGVRQHFGKIHDRRFKYKKCQECGAKFKTKYALRTHQMRVHNLQKQRRFRNQEIIEEITDDCVSTVASP